MLKYSVLIQYDNIDNIYVARIPELQGCIAHGTTQSKALKEIKTAMELWIETAKEVGEPIPEPSYIPVTLNKINAL